MLEYRRFVDRKEARGESRHRLVVRFRGARVVYGIAEALIAGVKLSVKPFCVRSRFRAARVPVDDEIVYRFGFVVQTFCERCVVPEGIGQLVVQFLLDVPAFLVKGAVRIEHLVH